MDTDFPSNTKYSFSILYAIGQWWANNLARGHFEKAAFSRRP